MARVRVTLAPVLPAVPDPNLLRSETSCPVCRHRAKPDSNGRCRRCRALVVRLVAGGGDPDQPRVFRLVRHLVHDAVLARALAWVLPGRVLPVVASYALSVWVLMWVQNVMSQAHAAVGQLSGPFVWLLGTLVWITCGIPFLVILVLIVLANALELMRMGFARTGDQTRLEGRLPILETRFYPMSLRGRRAFAVHVTFRTDKLSPTARVGLEVMVFGEDGKPLPGNLPNYRAPDGEFLVRELSGAVGVSDDYRYTMGALMPVIAIGLPRRIDEMVTLRAEVTLKLEGKVMAQRRLSAEFVARERDYPAPPKQRDQVEEAPATAEEIAFTSGVRASRGLCPVCGEGLEDEVVACESCHVPHHAECWAFAGRCSTYACEGDATAALSLVESAAEQPQALN